ncbi:aspartate/glutamate racemase family protein [Campylobacter blaseri]|uniref:Aspartate racemase n=1 Tax=Campylobacter blaseri TaxID=2042961 RepID=A0A2P8QYZ7_9BACT|nr:amino acid racemase [Campylobacter blaseri]PSM51462.1 aspartate racemase [Campylobacter blaseri]PSM52911.1 aspartate racemase [Campylobacter blaseri]QKF86534.1 aspartate/glutamate racemase family protein [Campylobacter blaseri]
MKRIGILGGMGPLATIDLYTKMVELTDAKQDQDNIPIIIDNYPQIPDRTTYILNKGRDPFPYMKESAIRLKNAGCEVICIACNTAHYFADRLTKECGINILHIADITTKAIEKNYPNAKKIAVIATTGTTKAKIYQDKLVKSGYEVVIIPDPLMENIMDCIYKGAKANNLNSYIDVFNNTMDKIEADVYIAACTEIPLFLPYATKKEKFVDATFELAKAAVKFSLEK